MFQNINSGYTLEPVTHILCLRQKTWTSSNSLAVHVKYVILLCTFLSKKKKKNVHNKITYLTKIVGIR